jgi:hypothetical protein
MKMKSDKFNSVVFEKDKKSGNGSAVIYVGPENAKEFQIGKVLSFTGITEHYTHFNFTIKLDRMYADQLIETFFPTILLWMLSYFTLFIKLDDFNERIMVSVTVLLVFAALLTPIKGKIPTTSYFKFIDLWFLWYITYMFSIILFHILLHGSSTMIERNRVSIGTKIVNVCKRDENPRKHMINEITQTLLLIPFILFNCIYFTLQFSN